MLDILRHAHLTHQAIFVAVHAGQVPNVRKYVL